MLFVLFFQETFSQNWKAQWITNAGVKNLPNTWIAFRKIISFKNIPSTVIARIATDSKYWLYINGKMVVFEGGLKRGPNPNDTYYDEVDIAPWLHIGINIIGVKVWYFGKNGFSHNNSGKAGLLFDCQATGLSLLSNHSWESLLLEEYASAPVPTPNYRLAESSLLYDARKAIGEWYIDSLIEMDKVIELGGAGSSPWNKLVVRPIPFFKDDGLKNYIGKHIIKPGKMADTILCKLPYNAQVTPYLKIQSAAGKKISIFTDNYLTYNGGATYIRSEYITTAGVQEYESLGWVNGHYVYYVIPPGVELLELKYRETGYDTEFSGSFNCSDTFFNRLWEKSLRTLYLTMRDTYMDCPDRERAQWTGDAVNQSGQSFYSLSTSSHALARKWLTEIVDWQKPDGTLYSPVPSGNWNKELPDQLLATIGYYGLWNYYLNTGDIETLKHAYEPAKKYVGLWKPDGNGLVEFRGGDWTWGDWGDNKDTVLIFHSFYYLALKGLHLSALALGYKEDADLYNASMQVFKTAFNNKYWNGNAYRNPAYKGATDDRVQALAVVAGIAEQDKFKEILTVFKNEEHASPYMEKYVFEALFQMGEPHLAMQRQKKRFKKMVNHTRFTTLWEGWNFNDPTYGGGTINHAWSGGGLTVLSQYLCGISPLAPGYKLFQIKPQPGNMKHASATVPSVAGDIKTSFINNKNILVVDVVVPPATSAVLVLPSLYSKITMNGKVVWKQGTYFEKVLPIEESQPGYLKFKVKEGNWKLVATKKTEE